MKTTQIGLTHRGRRANNEDNVLIEKLGGGGVLLAVADGMGGHRAGERASAAAVDRLARLAKAWERRKRSPQDFLRDAYEQINNSLYEEAQEDESASGMGTTLVVALVVNGELYAANVGDSRVYILDSSGIEQLTEDHRVLARSVRDGLMSEEEASASPWSSAITRAVGTNARVEADIFPDAGPGRLLEPGSVVFLSSDGLHGWVDAAEIDAALRTTADLGSGARHLQSLAYRKGSDDNISIAAVELGSLSRHKKRIKPLPTIQRMVGGQAAARRRHPVLAGIAVILSAILVVLVAATAYYLYQTRSRSEGDREREEEPPAAADMSLGPRAGRQGEPVEDAGSAGDEGTGAEASAEGAAGEGGDQRILPELPRPQRAARAQPDKPEKPNGGVESRSEAGPDEGAPAETTVPAEDALDTPPAQEPGERAENEADDSVNAVVESAQAGPLRVWLDRSTVRWSCVSDATGSEEVPDTFILIFSLDDRCEEIVATVSTSGSEIGMDEIIRLLERQGAGRSCYLTVILSFTEGEEIKSEPLWLEIDGID